MGEDLCKPCENCMRGEENLSLSQKYFMDNIKEDNIKMDNDYSMTESSKLLFYSIKKKITKSYKKSLASNNNENLKSTMISKNDETTPEPKVVVDENELNKIIYKYRVNAIIGCFKKLKKMKNKAHNIIQIRRNMKEKSKLIEVEDYEDANVDLFPEENYNYIGNLFFNKKDGFGIQYFPKSDASYVGQFLNDKRINYCKFEDRSKKYIYYGETDHNFTGHYGIYNNYEDHIYYEGEWKYNRKEGIGIEKYQDGGWYQGEFKNGFKHGIGIYFWNDGSKYEGEWENNLLEGYGIYKFSDGCICSGYWHSNQMNGFGKFTYPNVKCYLGYFKKDKKNGFGLIFWFKEKKAFDGYWKNNKQDGLGKFINEGNSKYGLWKEGNKILKYDENEFFELLKEKNQANFFTDIFCMDYDGLNDFIQNFNDF